MGEIFCSKCGNRIQDFSDICQECGNSVKIESDNDSKTEKSTNFILKFFLAILLFLFSLFIWSNISLHLIPSSLRNSDYFGVFSSIIMPIFILFVVCNLLGLGKKISKKNNK